MMLQRSIQRNCKGFPLKPLMCLQNRLAHGNQFYVGAEVGTDIHQSWKGQPLADGFKPASRKNKPTSTTEIKAVVTNERDYRNDVARLLGQIERATRHMKPLNKVFDVVFSEDDGGMLTINTPRGYFQFSPSPVEPCVVFKSYVTGWNLYRYHPEDNVWLSRKFDGHDLFEAVTRDMTKHLVGCPDFNHIDMRRTGSDNLLPSYGNNGNNAAAVAAAVADASVGASSGTGGGGASKVSAVTSVGGNKDEKKAT